MFDLLGACLPSVELNRDQRTISFYTNKCIQSSEYVKLYKLFPLALLISSDNK
jgi:hypothetical protein